MYNIVNVNLKFSNIRSVYINFCNKLRQHHERKLILTKNFLYKVLIVSIYLTLSPSASSPEWI